MKKKIKTKSIMSRIANQIEEDIMAKMIIYGEYAAFVEKLKREDFVQVEVYNPNTYLLTLAEVESVQQVLEPYKRLYGDNISCVFDTKHMIQNLGVVSVPTMQIVVHLSK